MKTLIIIKLRWNLLDNWSWQWNRSVDGDGGLTDLQRFPIFDLLQFAKLGCTMVLWDVNTAGNEETKEMMSKSGVTVSAILSIEKSERASVENIWMTTNWELINFLVLAFEISNLIAISSLLQVHTYTVDLSKREQINKAAKRVAKEVGTVDILVSNSI